MCLNTYFQFLNNITRIFIYFSTPTYFQKIQTTLLEQRNQTAPKLLRKCFMGIIKTQLIWNPKLLGKCFMVNTSLYHKYYELYIIWDNLERYSWILHIQSYLSTHPLRVFIFYLFFNQNKIKRWKKFLVNEEKNYLIKQSHGSFLSWLMVPTYL